MDTRIRKENHPGPRRPAQAARVGRLRPAGGAVRTCVPALSGQAGYREPADADDSDAHIVRGED